MSRLGLQMVVATPPSYSYVLQHTCVMAQAARNKVYGKRSMTVAPLLGGDSDSTALGSGSGAKASEKVSSRCQ